MKILPLLLLGGGAYFLTKKKPKASGSTTSNDSNKSDLPVQGFIIKDCELIDFNQDLAYDYAYSAGVSFYNQNKEVNLDKFRNQLFGDCLASLVSLKKLMSSTKNAKFIFDVIRYGYSGITQEANKIQNSDKYYLSELQKIYDYFKSQLGFFPVVQIELVKKI